MDTTPRRCTLLLLASALLLLGCGGGNDSNPTPPATLELDVVVDAGTVTGTLRPLWRDHYDLSFEHFHYAAEPGFSALLSSLEPRSWRCSVGRWEVGFPPPPGGDSTDPASLMTTEREYYRGPNTLAGADDPANYHFGYLDAQLTSLLAEGIEPYLCLDYMPFTLSSEQDPFNPNNMNVAMPGTPFSMFSFSDGIRTAPPADPDVYARVVLNTIRHVRGLFAGTMDFGIEWVEVGNEPDTVDDTGQHLPFFWTGTAPEFIEMYAAIAAAVDGDAQVSPLVKLGAGSFAFLPSPAGTAFLQETVAAIVDQSLRFDFLSFHTYGDQSVDHLNQFLLVNAITASVGLQVPWVNAEWGRRLGGADPAYAGMEHGLLRGKVLGLMQIFPFELAHEALFRDPGTGPHELGLVKTEPPTHKPVSRVYQALNRMNDCLQALDLVQGPNGLVVLSGRNAAGTRVCIAAFLEPAPDNQETELSVTVSDLPWGSGAFNAEVSRVTEASTLIGSGIESLSTESQSGGTYTGQARAQLGAEGLYLFELSAP